MEKSHSSDELLSEVHGDSLDSVPHLSSLLIASVQRIPNAPAVVSLHQSQDLLPLIGDLDPGLDPLCWTYSQLQRGVDLLASRLSSLGLTKGFVITIFSYNRAEWPLFFWAVVQLVCIFVPLNPRAISRKEEAQHMLNLIKPSVLVMADESMAKEIEKSVLSQSGSDQSKDLV